MTDDSNQKNMQNFLQDIEDEINGIQLTKEEKAVEIMMTAKTYMNAMTEINKNYNAALEGLINKLEDLNEAEKQVEDSAKISKVRLNLFK